MVARELKTVTGNRNRTSSTDVAVTFDIDEEYDVDIALDMWMRGGSESEYSCKEV